MPRYGMVIDTRKCVGCMDCVVACQTENDVPHGYCRDWITTETRGEFPQLTLEIRSERCNHCDRPPCVSCCPTGASHVEPQGQVVLVTAEKCIGCKACIAAQAWSCSSAGGAGSASRRPWTKSFPSQSPGRGTGEPRTTGRNSEAACPPVIPGLGPMAQAGANKSTRFNRGTEMTSEHEGQAHWAQRHNLPIGGTER